MKFYKLLLFIVLGTVISSCSVERKIQKARALAYQHPNRFADFCNDKFPVVEKYVKGKDSIVRDTTVVAGPTIPCPPNAKGEVVFVKCPDSKIIKQLQSRVDTIQRENTAKLQSLQNKCDAIAAAKDKEINDLKAEKASLKKQNDAQKSNIENITQESKRRWWWCVGLFALSVALAVWKFK